MEHNELLAASHLGGPTERLGGALRGQQGASWAWGPPAALRAPCILAGHRDDDDGELEEVFCETGAGRGEEN